MREILFRGKRKDNGDRRLKKYDLYYCDEDGNEIQ